MQILKESVLISFEEFSKLYHGEAKVLADHQSEDWRFVIDRGILKFHYQDFSPIFIDIKSHLERHQINYYKSSPYNELLAKALGVKKGKEKPRVLDASGGVLSDALLIKSFDVESLDVCERHPIAAALIINALKQGEWGISFHYQSALEMTKEFDVILFDPMYEDKNSRTAPKKEMLIFRDCVGADADAVEVAEHLYDIALNRLVIKRPIKSQVLFGKPTIQFKGKSTRYDVYMKL